MDYVQWTPLNQTPSGLEKMSSQEVFVFLLWRGYLYKGKVEFGQMAMSGIEWIQI